MTKNGKISIIALAAGVFACTAARAVGIMQFTDMKTGFLAHGAEMGFCLAFYVIIVAAAVITALFAPKTTDNTQTKTGTLSANKTLVIGWISVFMAALAAWDGIKNMNMQNPFWFIIVGDFAAAAYIEAVGIITLLKKKITAGIGFMYSIFGIYFVLRGISTLAQTMAVLSVQEYLTEALCATFGGVFFALFGKVISGNSEKHTLFFMRLWGAGAAVVTLSSAFGEIIAKLFGSSEISERITFDIAAAQNYMQNNVMSENGSYMMSVMPPVNIAMGIFAAVAVIMTLNINTKQDS